MKKTRLNLAVDLLSFLLLWLLTLSGLILQWKLPAGSGRLAAAHGPVRLLWNMDRQAWGSLHAQLSLLLTFALILHIWLHRQWIACTIKRKATPAAGQRWLLGALTLLVLTAATFAPLASPVKIADPVMVQASAEGQRVYEQNCLRCHGSDARGILPLPSDKRQAEARLRRANPPTPHLILKSMSESQLEQLIVFLRAQ